MIELSAAIGLIRQTARPLLLERVSLPNGWGRVLREPVVADLDTPPFNKSMMDGYAVTSTDIASGRRSLSVVGCVVAGEPRETELKPGEAIQIMTGAPIPAGADAVVMLEETSIDPANQTVTIRAASVRAGQHIMKRGAVYRLGDTLLPAGHRISASDVGILAEAGASQLDVARAPTVGVIATGNEICPPEQVPGPGEIRNSNGPLLLALVREQYAVAVDCGLARDNEEALTQAIRSGLLGDVLLLTGGVSAGMLDLVPRVLQSLGVRQIFHKVSLKPGKPVWFGTFDDKSHRCLVFGLPGNPVSTFACFHLLVTPALRLLEGNENGSATSSHRPRASLLRSHDIRGDRPTYWPSRMSIVDGQAIVEPLAWQGSADQRCLSQANCLAFFPHGDESYAAGSLIEVIEL